MNYKFFLLGTTFSDEIFLSRNIFIIFILHIIIIYFLILSKHDQNIIMKIFTLKLTNIRLHITSLIIYVTIVMIIIIEYVC